MFNFQRFYIPLQDAWVYLARAARRNIKPKVINLSKLGGSLNAFTAAFGLVIVWLMCGPFFNFSDTWQLIINTGTTIVTFLMAFSIQFSQNRDTKEIKMILKSLMKQNKKLRDQLVAIEKELDEDDE